jgi:hypothetical protein
MRNAATSSIIIYQLARQALRLPGEVAEVGVYKGGSAYLMAAIFDPDKPIHLFDIFAGMPPVDPENRQPPVSPCAPAPRPQPHASPRAN